MINIEIIGQNSNKINLKDTEMTMRIIEAFSKDLSKDELIENQMSGLKLRMNTYLNNQLDSQLIPTGKFLNEILDIYNIKKNKFAQHIEIEESNLHAILKGRRKFNNKIAKKIELIFKINAQLWMFIETKNELKKFNKENTFAKNRFSIKQLVQ